MKIVVTGAHGFIGSHLIGALAVNHEVIAVSRHAIASAAPGITWAQVDLTKEEDLASLPATVDAVIHLAQSKHYKQFPEKAGDIFGVNTAGTFHLLEYARRAGAKKFLFASTGGVYGYSFEKFVESDPINVLDFYFSSKYAAELLVASYRRFFTTIVFRFFFVYGPGQASMLISNLLNKVEGRQEITIDGDPGLRINPIFVDDAVSVFEPALRHSESALFNVAGLQVLSLTDIVEEMGRVFGQQPIIKHVAAKAIGDLVGDITLLRERLGVVPKVSMRKGIELIRQGRKG